MNKAEKISILSDTARRVLPENGEAWLFGSQARGTEHSGSDWDILILLDKEKQDYEDFDRYAYPFVELGWDIDAMISPVLCTKKTWADNWFSPFYKNVQQDRIRL